MLTGASNDGQMKKKMKWRVRKLIIFSRKNVMNVGKQSRKWRPIDFSLGEIVPKSVEKWM